ncbi:MAG TPA: hypothetical protein VFM80_07040, partial [Gracilimonas sp.]|nr:hypothetical protein [Gracilimonas sp.]
FQNVVSILGNPHYVTRQPAYRMAAPSHSFFHNPKIPPFRFFRNTKVQGFKPWAGTNKKAHHIVLKVLYGALKKS